MRRAVAIGLIVVAAVIIGTIGHQPTSSAARSLDGAQPPRAPGTLPRSAPSEAPPSEVARTGLTANDGILPDGVTVFDDRYPGVTNLNTDLLQALRKAAKQAAANDIQLLVKSGWRSASYQNQLLREAISQYGSEEEAARWVATADTSPHVSGDAVDIEPSAAAAWLSKRGARYGLCQIYRNEPWHYELRASAVERGCPRMYADPTHDPRMTR